MAHAQKPDFVFPRNGRVHLVRWGRQFSRLLAAEVCASAWVMLDRSRSEVAWEYWLPTPFTSFPFTSPPVRHRVPPGSERVLQHFFTLSDKRHDFRGRGEGNYLTKNVFFIFSTNFVWNVSRSKKNSSKCYHKCTQAFMWSTRYSCQILMKLEFCRQILEKKKSREVKFYDNPFNKSRGVPRERTDRQTDMNITVVAFCHLTRLTNARASTENICNRNSKHCGTICKSHHQIYTLIFKTACIQMKDLKNYRISLLLSP